MAQHRTTALQVWRHTHDESPANTFQREAWTRVGKSCTLSSHIIIIWQNYELCVLRRSWRFSLMDVNSQQHSLTYTQSNQRIPSRTAWHEILERVGGLLKWQYDIPQSCACMYAKSLQWASSDYSTPLSLTNHRWLDLQGTNQDMGRDIQSQSWSWNLSTDTVLAY